MKRIIFTLPLFFILLCTNYSLLYSQSGNASTASNPTVFESNQLILEFRSGASLSNLEQAFPSATISELDAGHTLFLLTFENGIPASVSGSCSTAGDQKDIIECMSCGNVIGNPGNGTAVGPDGIWPNYTMNVVANSNTFPDADFGTANCITVSSPDYDPLGLCGGLTANLPEQAFGEEVIDIAILDSGIDPRGYEDYFFARSEKGELIPLVEWHAYTPEEQDGTIPYQNYDPFGHGTAVALTAISLQHKYGGKHTVRLHSYRVLRQNGAGNLSELIRAFAQAAFDDMDIINISMGFKTLGCGSNQINFLEKIMGLAQRKGILVLASAGNEGNDLGVEPQFPAAMVGTENLYTVAATDCAGGALWDDSNSGADYINLTAPGADVLVPFVPGQCFISANGTSFATPLMASVIAGIRSNLNSEETKCLLDAQFPNVSSTSNDQNPGSDSFHALVGLDGNQDCVGIPPLDDDPISLITGTGGDISVQPVVVSPNPCINYFDVTVAAADGIHPFTIGVYDATTGIRMMVVQTPRVTTRINSSRFPSGVYTVVVFIGQERFTTRVIKQ